MKPGKTLSSALTAIFVAGTVSAASVQAQDQNQGQNQERATETEQSGETIVDIRGWEYR